MSAAPALPLSPDRYALRLAAQLAYRLARPIGHFDAAAIPLPPLGREAVAAMAGHPAFRGPINRAAARALAPAMAGIDRDCIARIGGSAATRLAVLLVCQPVPMLREAALMLGAGILHRRVVGLVLKADRERVRAALGPRAFMVATQEAPLLHARLGEIETRTEQAGVFGPADAETVQAAVVEVGLDGLARFVAGAEPPLAPAFALRRPPRAGAPRATPLEAGHREHVVRLMRRRMDAWSPIIA